MKEMEERCVSNMQRDMVALVKKMVDSEDYGAQITYDFLQNLHSLNDMKRKKTLFLTIPDEFLCSICGKVMQDPVVISTGETCDQFCFKQWLAGGNRTCPGTKQPLLHTDVTPNHLVSKMISAWCKDHGLGEREPKPVQEADIHHLGTLLGNLSSSFLEQKAAAKELRLLTKNKSVAKSLVREFAGSIHKLQFPLTPGPITYDRELEEDLITTVLNVSVVKKNKKVVGETPFLILMVVEALTSRSPLTRNNATSALYALSELDSNKLLIGKAAALIPLMQLLGGNETFFVEVAATLYSLCGIDENKTNAVGLGIISIIMKIIEKGNYVDEVLAILEVLCTHEDAINKISNNGSVYCLLRIMRERESRLSQEICASILYYCCHNQDVLKMIMEEENAYSTITKAAERGSDKGQRKAKSILAKLGQNDEAASPLGTAAQ